jgi:nitrogen fixation protein
MVKVEVHFRGGSVMEVEDWELFKMGPVHRPSSLTFRFSEEAKQYVPYLDFEEVVAVKVTELKGEAE